MTLLLAAHPLVHVNASLNSLATVLLLVGLYLIKRGRVKLIVACSPRLRSDCILGMLRLHLQVGRVETHRAVRRRALRHFAFACFAGGHGSLWRHGKSTRDQCAWLLCSERHQAEDGDSGRLPDKHRRWARVTFPIWLYVSVTGVVVYVMSPSLAADVNKVKF